MWNSFANCPNLTNKKYTKLKVMNFRAVVAVLPS